MVIPADKQILNKIFKYKYLQTHILVSDPERELSKIFSFPQMAHKYVLSRTQYLPEHAHLSIT